MIAFMPFNIISTEFWIQLQAYQHHLSLIFININALNSDQNL